MAKGADTLTPISFYGSARLPFVCSSPPSNSCYCPGGGGWLSSCPVPQFFVPIQGLFSILYPYTHYHNIIMLQAITTIFSLTLMYIKESILNRHFYWPVLVLLVFTSRYLFLCIAPIWMHVLTEPPNIIKQTPGTKFTFWALAKQVESISFMWALKRGKLKRFLLKLFRYLKAGLK